VPQRFEIIEHPADVGFVAYGETLEELFASAAAAMMTLACDPATLEERERREIDVAAGDVEMLLFAWLAEILAVSDAEQIFFRRADVTQLRAGRVRGVVYGEKYDKARHRAGTYIKAVTLHQFRVEQTPAGWKATVYLDV
jgi:SHS2 domain-containing protein